MPRGIVDFEGLAGERAEALRACAPSKGLPFDIKRIGHLALKVRDLERSVRFYTEILGFQVSDVYPETMMPGGMAFLRCNADHHGVALVGCAESDSKSLELHHLAFEVATLGEVLRARDHLKAHGVPIDFAGRRRAGCQVAVEFLDPDGHHLEIYWGIDQVGSDGRVRPPEDWREALTLEDAVANPPPGQDTSFAR